MSELREVEERRKREEEDRLRMEAIEAWEQRCEHPDVLTRTRFCVSVHSRLESQAAPNPDSTSCVARKGT